MSGLPFVGKVGPLVKLVRNIVDQLVTFVTITSKLLAVFRELSKEERKDDIKTSCFLFFN